MNWMLIRFVRTTLNRAMVAAWLAVALVPSAWGWSDHASLVWPLLRSQPELIHQTVAAEPLGAFLAAQQTGIAETLEAVESWSVATIEHYPPTPEELRWGMDHVPTTERFFAAIRVNPMLPYRLYVDLSPERAQPEQPPLAWSELSFFWRGYLAACALVGGGQPLDCARPGSGASLAGGKPMRTVPLRRALVPVNA